MEVNIKINNIEFTCSDSMSILDAARLNGIDIPTLCYDPRVDTYGGCGLCVVELDGSPRLFRACSTTVSDGMSIKTNTERVFASRKMALELLLSDHIGDCKAPCVLACPAQTDCQGYVALIANGEYKEADALIKDKIPLPASIGRICPHPCEKECRRQMVEDPIAIAHLKSFAADATFNSNEYFIPECKEHTGKKVAVIGGGPGGLSAGYYLVQFGHDVTIYDSMPKMGGMLRYGIPEYRLPKKILDREIKNIAQLGVKMINNIHIGKDISFTEIISNYDAVVVAIGAWSSMMLNCPGEDLEGVIGGIDFLRNVALEIPLGIKGKKVAVVGGGNTAMDACRTAIRLGASDVYNIYRRTQAEMPAEEIEITEAEEEGVIFKNLTNPIELIGENGKVNKIKLQKMELGEPDASGRRRPCPIEGCEEILDVDFVIIAIGQNTFTEGFSEISLTKRNTLAADANTYLTNIQGVFAIGDATNRGADIAISAIAESKGAATVIDSYLNGNTIQYKKPFVVERDDITEKDFCEYEKNKRVEMPHLSPEQRKNNFKEITFGFTEEEAKKEASRCLKCGCADYFECQLIKYSNEYNVQPSRLTGEVHKRTVDSSHPYIERNANKCILCGLCVRVCDEVMGATALGLVGRGFDTVVKPALDKPLTETDCISCGQCVALCPTGALLEKTQTLLPILENITNTTCSMCGIGCNVNLTSKGNTLIRALPGNDKELLCVKGRFEFNEFTKKQIVKPMIKNNNQLNEVSYEEAIGYISDKISRIAAEHGVNAIGISLSDKLTNEEISAIKQYAKKIGTNNIFSFSSINNKYKLHSTATFDELKNAATIILSSNIYDDYPIAGIKIKQAAKKGAKLIEIDDLNTLTTDHNEYFNDENTVYVLDEGKIDCTNTNVVEVIKKLTQKMIILKPNCNSQGLLDADILPIENSEFKALIVFGEDINDKKIDEIEFLTVVDCTLTNTAKKAHCILPLLTFAEKSGTYTSTDGIKRHIKAAIEPLAKLNTFQILDKLSVGRQDG